MNLQLTLLLAYSVLLIVLGLWIGRLVRTTGAFFVAGRRLGPLLVFSTLLAANIGAGSTVGAAGLGFRDGLAAWWWVGSAGLGSLALALWIGPRIWAEARRHDLHTVGDFLELHFGATVRGIVAALLWIGTLAILAGQLIALAWVLNVVAGIPKYLGCLVGGIVMTTYFASGGLLASAWVNAVQLVVLLLGFGFALPLALANAGGWTGVVTALQGRSAGDYFHFWQGGGSGCLYLALLGPAFIISPGLLQKVFGARDRRAIRLGVGANAVALLLFAFVPPILGMIARARYPTLPVHELALPTVLMNDLPVPLAALGLAALFSAEVSSADAILFMLATSLSRDLYRRFVNPAASDAGVLVVARLAAIVGGVLGVALAILLPTVIASLTIFYALLSVSLFVPVVAGLYSRRVGRAEALAAVGAGVAVMVAAHLGTGGRGFGSWSPSVLGLLASGLGFGGVFLGRSLMRRPDRLAATR